MGPVHSVHFNQSNTDARHISPLLGESVGNMELTNEQKRVRTEKIAKVVIAGVVCLAVSPVIFLVVKGLIGLIVAAAIGFAALQFAPYFAIKVANFRMRLITDDARRNPVENMQTIYLDNMTTIGEKDKKIASFAARVGDYKSKMAAFNQKHPNDAADYQRNYDRLVAVLQRQLTKQKVAKQKARDYKEKMEYATDLYQMALDTRAVNELAGDLEKQVYADIRSKVAFDSITHQFNTAVAELTVEADTDPDNYLTGTSTATEIHGALPESTGGSYEIPKATIIDAEVVSVSVKKGSR